jgi:hypothetical protein
MKSFISVLILLLLVSDLFSQSWTKADQPDGGEIISYDVNPADPDKIVIMTRRFLQNLIWYSGDGGLSWNEIGESKYTGSVRIDPVNNRIYATGFAEVLVTSDYGENWIRTLTGGNYSGDIRYNPLNSSEILCTNRDGIYRSKNYGEEWELVYPEFNANTIKEITYSPHIPGLVIVKKLNGFLISFDNGVNWEYREILYGDFYHPVVFDPIDDSTMYARYYRSETLLGILKTTDLGINWNIINDHDYSINACYAEDEKTVIISRRLTGLYKTTDFGESWSLISPQLPVNKVYYNGDKLYAVFNPHGFAVYDEEDNWTFRGRGIKAWQVSAMSVHDSLVFVSTYSNTFRKEGSEDFIPLLPLISLRNIIFYSDSAGFGLEGAWPYKIYKTTDRGLSWNYFSGFNIIIKDIKVIGSTLVLAAGDYTGDNNKGIYTTPVSQPSWSRKLDGYNLKVMYDGNYLYGFGEYATNLLLRSSNLGNSWEEVGPLSAQMDYTAFAVKDIPEGIFIGGYRTDGGPSLSTPGRLYFIKPDKTILTLYTRNVYDVIAPEGREEYFVMKFSQGTVLKADSLMGSLYNYEEGLVSIINDQGGFSFYHFNSAPYKNKIFTNRGGLMELNMDVLVVGNISSEEMNPVKYSLSSNYPNPFNPSTTIRYSLAETERVTLNIYDLLGREVFKLLDEEKPAGEYEIKWNAASFPSGAYFVRMQAGQFSETRKLLLMK